MRNLPWSQAPLGTARLASSACRGGSRASRTWVPKRSLGTSEMSVPSSELRVPVPSFRHIRHAVCHNGAAQLVPPSSRRSAMSRFLLLSLILVLACTSSATAQRRKPKVKARPASAASQKLPEIKQPVMFDTPEADAILRGPAGLPAGQPWNTDVSKWPLHPNSAAIVASIGPDKPLRYNTDMASSSCRPTQKKIELRDRRVPGRIGQRAVSRCPTTCRSKAGRRGTSRDAGRQEAHARRRAARQAPSRRRPARHRRRSTRRHARTSSISTKRPTAAGRPRARRSST